MGTWLSSPKKRKSKVVVTLDDLDKDGKNSNKEVLVKQQSTRSIVSGSQQSNHSGKTPRTEMGNFIVASNKNLYHEDHISRRVSNAQAAAQDIRKRQHGSKQSSGQNSAKNSAKNSGRNSPRTPSTPTNRHESGLFNVSNHGEVRNKLILSMKLDDMLDDEYVDRRTNTRHESNGGNFILSPYASTTNPFDTTTHSGRGSSVSSDANFVLSQSPLNSSGNRPLLDMDHNPTASLSRRDSSDQYNRPPSLKLNSTMEALLHSPINSARRDSVRRDSTGHSPLNSGRRDSKQLLLLRKDSKSNGSFSGINSDKDSRDRGSFDRSGNPRYQRSSLTAIESGVDLSTMMNNGHP